MASKRRFDCVEMKRSAQRKIRRRVRGMTPAQEMAFFGEGREQFQKAVEMARGRRSSARSKRRAVTK